MKGVIKDSNFELLTEMQKPDAKKRLSIGQAMGDAAAYNIYRNPLGQIVLDPVKAVPPSMRLGYTKTRGPWPQ